MNGKIHAIIYNPIIFKCNQRNRGRQDDARVLNWVANIQLQIVVYLDQSCALVHQAVRQSATCLKHDWAFRCWMIQSNQRGLFRIKRYKILHWSKTWIYVLPWRPGKGIEEITAIIFKNHFKSNFVPSDISLGLWGSFDSYGSHIDLRHESEFEIISFPNGNR